MKNEDIEHLAALSRIKLSEAELSEFSKEITAILDYVGIVQDMVSDEADETPKVGVRHNIFREDIATNQPDSYTEEILSEMPRKQGRYLEVKKILKTDTN